MAGNLSDLQPTCLRNASGREGGDDPLPLEFGNRIRSHAERGKFDVSVVLTDRARIVPNKFLNDGRTDPRVFHQTRRGVSKAVKGKPR